MCRVEAVLIGTMLQSPRLIVILRFLMAFSIVILISFHWVEMPYQHHGSNSNITKTVETIVAVKEIALESSLPAEVSDSIHNWPLQYKFNGSVGLRFEISPTMLEHLGLPPKYTNLTEETKNDLVFVTASSWTHYIESLDAIASVQKHFPKSQLLYYDWGLAEWQKKKLHTMCRVELRDFNMTLYHSPPYNGSSVKYQILKPLLIASVLKEFPGVIYLDASVRFMHGNLNNVQSVALKNGGITILTGTMDSIYSVTHNGTYKYLPSNLEKLKTVPCLQSGALLVYNTEFVFRNILWWWYLCAWNKPCVAPPQSQVECTYHNTTMTEFRGCHRFDQSALNILTANLYDFNFRNYLFAHDGYPLLCSIERHPTRMYNVSYCKN